MNKSDTLKREMKETKDARVPAEPIVNHLLIKCETDPDFAERIEMKNKKLKKCFDYVFNEVKKRLEGKNGWVADDEVYNMAETYYLLNMTDLEDINLEDAKEGKKDKKAQEKKNTVDEKEEVKVILDKQQVSIFDIVG